MATREIQSQNPNKLTSLSVQLPNRYTLLVHEAAQKAGSASTALYVGQAVLDKACDELGLEHVDLAFIKSVASGARKGSVDAATFMRDALKQVDGAKTESEARRILRTAESLIAERFGAKGDKSSQSGTRSRAGATPAKAAKKRS